MMDDATARLHQLELRYPFERERLEQRATDEINILAKNLESGLIRPVEYNYLTAEECI